MNPFKLKPGFLSHIAGLRGLAVSLVVLSHLAVPGFANGFIGVDIFFVISGFLITGIIAKEYERNRERANGFGWISLKHFYFRRAKRILPASLFVSISVLAFSFFTQNVFAFGRVLNDFWWATFFGANLNFLQQSTNYFQQTLTASPFQHYWSLSIEEQFYFIWPSLFLLAVSFNALRTFGKRLSWRTRALILVGVLTLGSLEWMVLDFAVNPTKAYFSLTARGWELGVGAAAALAHPYLNTQTNKRATIAGTSLVAVLGSLFIVNQSNFGLTLAVPVMSTAAYLIFGDALGQALNPLRWPIFTYLGNISYSLYLWHWPLIVFAMQKYQGASPFLTIGLVFASLALATLTFSFVEQPILRVQAPETWEIENDIRADSHRRVSGAVLGILAFSLLICFSSGAQFVTAAFQDSTSHQSGVHSNFTRQNPPPLAPPASTNLVTLWQKEVEKSASQISKGTLTNGQLDSLRKYFSKKGQTWFDDAKWSCKSPVPGTIIKRCTAGKATASKRIVLMGDSHAEMFSGALQQIARDNRDIAVVAWIHQQCPNSLFASGIRSNQEVTDPSLILSCNYFHKNLINLAGKDIKGGIVAVADFAPKNLAKYQVGNIAFLRAIKKTALKVFTIGSSPTYPPLVTCMDKALSNASKCGGSQTAASNYEALDAQAAMTNYVPSAPWFCFSSLCPIFIKDTLVSLDGGHITDDFSVMLAPVFLQALSK